MSAANEPARGQITVRYRIALKEYVGGTMSFYKWIPSTLEDNLVVEEDEIAIRVYAAAETDLITECDISKLVNVPVKELIVEVAIPNVDSELIKFIYDERERHTQTHHGVQPGTTEFKRLTGQYEQLGFRALEVALKVTNRLIAWVRTEKGQHWLNDIRYSRDNAGSLNVGFRATVLSSEFDWTRWYPPAQHTINVFVTGEERSIHDDDWKRAQEFLDSNSKSNIVLHLLANAEQLLEGGHLRSSIIEAVSALEVATFAFGRAPELSGSFPADVLRRLGAENLEARIRHLGLSGTVNYLLPLLFPPTILSDSLIKEIQELLNVRGTVVHQGQRIVSEGVVRRTVAAARKSCDVLIQHTKTS